VLYEDVRLRWQELVISRFENYLNIRFEVTKSEIALDYSLHHCAGSRMLARVFSCRTDVDRGFFRARRDETGLVRIEALKCIRFTDLLSRRMPHQGAPGAGQLMNRTVPAVLGIWLDHLMANSIRQWESESQAMPFQCAPMRRESSESGGGHG
jgi:hypothetical protein